MKFKLNKNRMFYLVVIFVMVLVFTLYNWSSCTVTEYLDTSIQIEDDGLTHVGLNSDTKTNQLNFGKLSSSASVERSVKVGYTRDARVTVSSVGDFSSWMNINLPQFLLKESEEKEVFFTVNVPENTPQNVYSGKIKFCFKE